MSLTSGSRLGVYEVVSPLGAGGMGEVYRARDTQLKREVALKVLPDGFASDPDRHARFQREAELLAALNHPNIAAVYGIADGRAIVLELVEGETLADMIARGPVPIADALAIARQIADALEAAHEKGVIHRDLKPANIKITPDGRVKVLDFGLAKAFGPSEGGLSAVPEVTASPTLMSPALMTGSGVILGTAAYMSPEQARGRAVDRRADIWAFGCVVYEMLTGTRPFEGEDPAETIGAVIHKPIDWSRLPPQTSDSTRRLLRRCLQKDPHRRISDVRDARLEIEDAGEMERPVAPAVRERRRERIAWIACAVATAAALVAAAVARRPAPPLPELRFDIVTPPTTDPASLAVSPDGLKIVFVAESEGRPRLWLRSLDSVVAEPLPPTDGAALPFWSPDSRSVGFFAGTRLKRIDIESQATQTLADVPRGFGGTWNGSGDVLFAPASGVPIRRVSASGGEYTEVTRLEPQHSSHRFPQFLPDGRHFLFYVEGAQAVRGVWVGQLGDTGARRVVDADAAAVFAASGHLLYVRQGALFAHAFDPASQALAGDPLPIAEQTRAMRGIAALSASAAGPIGYRMGDTVGRRQLTWVDRSGRELETVGDPIPSATFSPAMSADGRRVAQEQSLASASNVWIFDLVRRVASRFTFGATIDNYPVWSPDGTRVVFSSVRGGVLDLYEKSATGAGDERLVLATKVAKIASDWSPDGRVLLYRMGDDKGGNDIWALPMDGTREPFLVVDTMFDAREAQFSPDGRWIAYQSDESGRFEVYVQPFAGRDGKASGKWQMSTAGGAQVRWRRDGRELYYIALDGRMMAVPVQLSPEGETVEALTPVPLFQTRVGGAVQSFARQQYVVSPDGQRFLMGNVVEEGGAPITVILNWRPPGR